jgi:hypothetical protein
VRGSRLAKSEVRASLRSIKDVIDSEWCKMTMAIQICISLQLAEVVKVLRVLLLAIGSVENGAMRMEWDCEASAPVFCVANSSIKSVSRS